MTAVSGRIGEARVRVSVPLLVLALVILAAPFAADAQQGRKVYRIGWLAPGSAASALTAQLQEAFRQGLKEQGWYEGQTVLVERRYAEGQNERLLDLAKELVQLRPQVIVTAGTPATQALKQATTEVPIVFVAVADPVGSSFVGSLAHPGGNLTGIATWVPGGFLGKWIELLREAVPKISHVAALIVPTNQSHRQILSEEADLITKAQGVTLLALEVRGLPDLAGAFESAKRQRVDAVVVFGDALTFLYRAKIAEMALEQRLPTFCFVRENVEAGGLMAYGPHLADLWRRAAIYVDRILKGAKPADLPVEQPTKFELVINMRTAKALRLTIPQSLLLRADQVIE